MTINIPHMRAIHLATDPTRTLTIRNKFVAQMERRFKLLMKDVNEAIVDLDVLGLGEAPRLTLNAVGLQPGAFDFATSQAKIEAFVAWMNSKAEEYLLSGGRAGINILGGRIGTARDSWINTYIDSAYQQGIRRARQELKKAGIPIDDGFDPTRTIQVAFNSPVHADRVGMIYSRAFSSLKGIVGSMDSTVSDVLALGIADGRGPREIARLLNKRLMDIGKGEEFAILDSLGRQMSAKRRALILARTEVIRAHHAANIAEYRAAGILGIKIQVEVLTAGDNRVCAICLKLFPKGNRFSIAEAEHLIPAHPQCRCVALPYIPEDK